MGLAAGQARLLSITSRKSDCEFQSMRLSHQKIALARELADLSNEYQNSLDQTKLIYDYYGTGDTNTPLTYGILMTPSALNDYMPVTLTDSSGRVTLNSKYAAAARRAGIPQEGLGSLPSETMRNEFINGLADAGLITNATANTMLGIPYNQGAGFGGDTTMSVLTENVTLNELAEILDDYVVTPTDGNYDSSITCGVVLYDNNALTYYKNGSSDIASTQTGGALGLGSIIGNSNYKEMNTNGQVTLGQILNGDYTLIAQGKGNRTSSIGYAGGAIDAVVTSSVWDVMMDTLESLLDLGDGVTGAALEYARAQIQDMISNQCNTEGRGSDKGDSNASKGVKYQFFNDNDMKNFAHKDKKNKQNNRKVVNTTNSWVSSSGSGYIGLVGMGNADSGHDDKNDKKSTIGVNLSSVMKAYLTYFYDYMNGVDATDINGNDKYYVGDKLSTSSLVDNATVLTIKTGTVSSDDLSQSVFYDTLFNQICASGWTEDGNIDDKEYLQQLLQSGKLYISKIKDDGYYYQANYATDSYIKEIADDTYIAQAEAKYNTQKAKLNSKEETLALKMKNLDTEISSLTTEYDTVKNTISKNIEKSFKRYNA